jgi:hypothetical protein
MEEFAQVIPQKRLTPGKVQFPEAPKFWRGKQFQPVQKVKVGNVPRNLPDIAHAASADTAMGDFEAYRFKPVWFAGEFQQAIAKAIVK